MRRNLYALNIDIGIESPYLVHGSDPGRYGLDATLLTNHHGLPIIPGSLLAGRIAELLHSHKDQLNGMDADYWFGKGGVAGLSGGRSRIFLDDLPLMEIDGKPVSKPVQTEELTRNRLNDGTGAGENGALLIIEQIALPGARLRFAGGWRAWLTPEEAELVVKQFRGSLILQTQLGADRTIGFGRVKSVKVTVKPHDATPLDLRHGFRHRLALRGDSPLCVGARSRRGNVFESDDILSGGTILGALSGMLTSRHRINNLATLNTALARNFSRLRCTHALPAQIGGARPAPLPQSLVALDNDICDAWKHAQPPAVLELTPAFQTDWKDKQSDQASARRGWGKTRRHLRVRTDIDGEGKAKESALFAYECVVARLDDSGSPETEWLFDLDLADIPDAERTDVNQELAELLAYGLFPVGKTDAVMQVHVIDSTQAGARSAWNSGSLSSLKPGEQVPLLLITDALLFPTAAVANSKEVDLAGIYGNAFDSLAKQADCDGALEFSHHFATQRLAGGDYMKLRFFDPKKKDYQPWVLTEAGSVFVFKVVDAAKAAKLLDHWQTRGLDLPEAVKKDSGGTWQDHPYLRESGYGEVLVAPQHGFPEL